MPGQGDKDEAMVQADAQQDVRQAERDHSQDSQREIVEVVKVALVEHALNTEASITAKVRQEMTSMMPVTIKTSSGATGVSAMPTFDWNRDNQMYQQWLTWSEKAKHAAAAMEGDSEASKVHYFYNWIGAGASAIENWKRKGTLIPQGQYDKLNEDQKKDKYSLDKLESYFILLEKLLAPRFNPLLAVEDLHCLKQISMNAGEFYSQAHEIIQRCNLLNKEAEERAIRDALYLGMRPQKVKDKCINFMNDGEEVTIDFIMKYLKVEDSNSHHKSLSQMDSTTGVNFYVL